MAKRIQPQDREEQRDNHPGMSREVAISRSTVGSEGLYVAVVKTPPGGATRVHHHGPCETCVYVTIGRARFTWSANGAARELVADPGDFVYIPAGEAHVESNVSLTEPLEVIVMRNCSEPITVVVE